MMMTGICSKLSFQLAATRRRLGGFVALFNFNAVVSTRSHAKAAGPLAAMCSPTILFQLAATRRRLVLTRQSAGIFINVSTRSHAKAAGPCADVLPILENVSTRSHAKAAGLCIGYLGLILHLFQLAATRRRLVRRKENSGARIRFQLAATRRRLGMFGLGLYIYAGVSTRSHAKAAGKRFGHFGSAKLGFQLAATRRRLGFAPNR